MIYSILVVLLLVAFVLTIGMEGIWSGVLMTVNVIVAGIVATAFYEPLAQYMQGLYFGGTFYWDIFALVGIFALVVMILRHVTDLIAPQHILFPKTVDQVGGIAVALLCGWITVSFASVAMQTAPMESKPIWGSFEPGESNFAGLAAPDYHWLYFFQHVATGSLAPLEETKPKDLFYEKTPDEFVTVYQKRRSNFCTPTLMR